MEQVDGFVKTRHSRGLGGWARATAGFIHICSGGSGHAMIDIPNVPCLVYDSAFGSLRELNGPIVIDLTDLEWPRVMV
jgi:hypothetical protein